ncbi:diacylglycerol/lipid kinase family protein [Pedobacter boryungensis]|uniref:YegS/Rv2252/BmrU family lipid kinase n=1 Tax=Pedobacter boryungensis TaxID=869962 RepID=A0ABX2DFN2_9SPHI|nr:YegS/Rv2252/BmrU family lipid kinase [Pedobacter boryungensis]NQX32912.1 YegS/Rv2252/BmrU family lipid kinase [Pedobacter boryungensis]
MKSKTQKLLFIVNPGSGNDTIDYKKEIKAFFKSKDEDFEIYELPKDCAIADLKTTIKNSKADRVIAVGGDGTLKLVAECLLETTTPIGIIPAGSANGMAKELNIPLEIKDALALAITGKPKQIHTISINDELCIHLADIGFNAYLVKRFDELNERGMWTYAKAAWQAFWNHRKMEVEFKIGKKLIKHKAAMVAIANATAYGTGLEINPDGKLDDDLFEIILVKEYAVMEILKIWISKLPWNPKKIQRFQASNLKITTKHKVHFQVDGEYIGKVNEIAATLIPKAIRIIAGPSA